MISRRTSKIGDLYIQNPVGPVGEGLARHVRSVSCPIIPRRGEYTVGDAHRWCESVVTTSGRAASREPPTGIYQVRKNDKMDTHSKASYEHLRHNYTYRSVTPTPQR